MRQPRCGPLWIQRLSDMRSDLCERRRLKLAEPPLGSTPLRAAM